MLMYVSSNLEKLVLDSSSIMNMTKCKAFFFFIYTDHCVILDSEA